MGSSLQKLALALSFALVVSAWGSSAQAQDMQAGSVTGLPVPRYVSLKSDRVNLREGPSKDHRTRWIYQKTGLPVEIVAEFETWRRVRDSDGSEGWVLHSLLSGRRTALIAPWTRAKNETFTLYRQADKEAAVVARLEPGVIANVENCDKSWCRVRIARYEGFMPQERLWGVYPNEKVE